jgi:hypothetical protein
MAWNETSTSLVHDLLSPILNYKCGPNSEFAFFHILESQCIAFVDSKLATFLQVCRSIVVKRIRIVFYISILVFHDSD